MNSLLDPAILFFVFGIFAGLIRSNLEIPAQIARFLSLYLLMALGLKGGFALSHSGLNWDIARSLGLAISLALIVPTLSYLVLRKLVSGFDAAALAATYGSVSAVTFITATQYLEKHGLSYGGHMSAAMALMESPAIVFAVLLANTLRQAAPASTVSAQTGVEPRPAASSSIGKIVHESLTDGAQLLLIGAMLVGILSGDTGKAAMQPFSGDLFKGMLAFFLLDMGLKTARSLPELRDKSPLLLAWAVLAPVCHAALALGLAWLLQISAGDGGLLMVLAASASYIAVPAVLRYAVPEASPSLYFSLSLGLTFPINILFGIPFYLQTAQSVLGGAH
ncbi:sodium-dependent bicarbonate transport family permease [Undibacterium sp. CY7W]|uniref:Sodium-dependent bicarbonate transport family permease n=1 Tax=Undibacterium rugosum TaxID=2762291 RepID=A0A923KZV0_9BURK|nr:sodium-dependent bicarbonate transport family permease [Undibacterium rugosum]MBC3935721.1 sodium-dependent bicarbonate transport family permease [Undibacterium rugosum]